MKFRRVACDATYKNSKCFLRPINPKCWENPNASKLQKCTPDINWTGNITDGKLEPGVCSNSEECEGATCDERNVVKGAPTYGKLSLSKYFLNFGKSHFSLLNYSFCLPSIFI